MRQRHNFDNTKYIKEYELFKSRKTQQSFALLKTETGRGRRRKRNGRDVKMEKKLKSWRK